MADQILILLNGNLELAVDLQLLQAPQLKVAENANNNIERTLVWKHVVLL